MGDIFAGLNKEFGTTKVKKEKLEKIQASLSLKITESITTKKEFSLFQELVRRDIEQIKKHGKNSSIKLVQCSLKEAQNKVNGVTEQVSKYENEITQLTKKKARRVSFEDDFTNASCDKADLTEADLAELTDQTETTEGGGAEVFHCRSYIKSSMSTRVLKRYKVMNSRDLKNVMVCKLKLVLEKQKLNTGPFSPPSKKKKNDADISVNNLASQEISIIQDNSKNAKIEPEWANVSLP